MPDQFTIQNAIGNALNSQWQDPTFLQTYGNYGPQFPNQSTQTGAAMYSNIQPMAYTPPWMVTNLPPRLQGPGYLNGGNMSNYGPLFAQYGPRQLGNPYPINGYDPTHSMNVPPAYLAGGMNYNPFLRNQTGNWPFGAPGGAGGFPGYPGNTTAGMAQDGSQQGAMQMSSGGYGGGMGGGMGGYSPQGMSPYGMGMQQQGMGYGMGMGMPQQMGMMGGMGGYGPFQSGPYGGFRPQMGMGQQSMPQDQAGSGDKFMGAPPVAPQYGNANPMETSQAAPQLPPQAQAPNVAAPQSAVAAGQPPMPPQAAPDPVRAPPAAMGLMSSGAFNPMQRAGDSSFGGPDPYANGALGAQAQQATSGGGQVPGYGFDSAPATTDPGSMAALLAFFGGNQGNGNTIPQQQQAYLDAYRQRYPLGVPGIQNYISPTTNYLTGTR